MLTSIEAMNQCVWGNKVTLATSSHLLGGVGIGLLVSPNVAQNARSVGWALVSLSALAHLYAYLTRCPTSRVTATEAALFS